MFPALIAPEATRATGPARPFKPPASVVMLPVMVKLVLEVLGDEFTSSTNPPLTPVVLICPIDIEAALLAFPPRTVKLPPRPLEDVDDVFIEPAVTPPRPLTMTLPPLPLAF